MNKDMLFLELVFFFDLRQIEKYGISSKEVFGVDRFFEAAGSFFGIFLGSPAIGALMGCINALLTKFTKIKDHPVLETALFVLISISAFQATEACEVIMLH